MDKKRLVNAIRAGRARLETAVDVLDETQALAPGALGEWSVKEMLAHIAGWEKWLVERLDAIVRDEEPDLPSSPLSQQAIDAFNAEFVESNAGCTWAETLADFRHMLFTLVRTVENTPAKVLFDPDYLPWGGGQPLWPLVAACTYEHYQEHLPHVLETADGAGAAAWTVDRVAELCLAIQSVPAPTGAETERAEFVASRMRRIGLKEVELDDTPNVYARVQGVEDGPGVMVSAHLDTVFPLGTDLTSRREGSQLYGPGIGDNSMGLAGLLALAEKLAQAEEAPLRDVWFVANAGEEGLGDLKGMRCAVDRLGTQLKACIVLEGTGFGPWSITHRGLGARRYKIEAQGRGGHSWGAFGEPSAIHQLVRIASLITRWDVPAKPRTTFNIGVIEGGTSVNSIAEHASMLLDLRSEDPQALHTLVTRTEDLVSTANAIGDIRFTATLVGDRPTGEIPVDHPLVAAATRIMEELGAAEGEIQYRIGSTDANVPLSRGLPAVTIYLTRGYEAHRRTEWLSLDMLPAGLTLAWRLLHWAISAA